MTVGLLRIFGGPWLLKRKGRKAAPLTAVRTLMRGVTMRRTQCLLACLAALSLTHGAAADALSPAFAVGLGVAGIAVVVIGVALTVALTIGGLWLIDRLRGKAGTPAERDEDVGE